ncbi:MAG TPA: hypothetical protein PLD27_02095 [bacterium]|nr:hypothetical protein [bacterium]HOL46664.1 hypothetical protein [bacterium]HPQ18352.1 hypothetical protein [bacterium]
MFHPTIKIIVIVLLFFAAGLYVIFFTKTDEQIPWRFADKKKNELKITDDKNEAIFKEYNLGDYYVKIGKFYEAMQCYHNVYYKYPEVQKGYLKWRALQNIKLLEKIFELQKKKEEAISDTQTIIKKYFSHIK